MHLRAEHPDDEPSISRVIELAFENHPYSDHTEARIVERLRAAKALAVSLVAVECSEVVGHVACSPVSIGGVDSAWFGLGPLAVRPDLQGRGIGSALVRASIDLLKATNAEGICLVGEPSYYQRFGLQACADWSYPGLPATHFLVLLLRPPTQTGVVRYHQAFEGQIN